MRKPFSRAFYCILFLFGLSSCLNSDKTNVLSSSDTSPCTLNVATAGPCTVSSAGAYVTTSAGADITSWANDAGSTTVSAQITNGFYSDKFVMFTSNNLLAGNIRGGINIFGVTGTYSTLSSTAHRTRGASQISAYSEVTSYSGLKLPTLSPFAYHEVPNIDTDDEGAVGGSVTHVSRTGWSGKTCGDSGSITDRIADCLSVLGAAATWDGTVKGNSGQAIWKIVSRTGDCGTASPADQCRELWRDERTGLIWSSRVSSATNWCKASGNSQTDSNSYCNNPTYQSTSGAAISACYDGGFTSSYSDIDSSLTNVEGKGGFTSTASATRPALIWRLPSMNDWQVANSDGIRFVMPDMGQSATGGVIQGEWSATVNSADRSKAWVFDFYQGGFSTATRNNQTLYGVRCVGH